MFVVEALKMKHASHKKKSNSFLRSLQNHSLPTYLALRRQKVKLGPLKSAAGDLEFFVSTPDAVTAEDRTTH
jgi:hypothetical protein